MLAPARKYCTSSELDGAVLCGTVSAGGVEGIGSQSLSALSRAWNFGLLIRAWTLQFAQATSHACHISLLPGVDLGLVRTIQLQCAVLVLIQLETVDTEEADFKPCSSRQRKAQNWPEAELATASTRARLGAVAASQFTEASEGRHLRPHPSVFCSFRVFFFSHSSFSHSLRPPYFTSFPHTNI